jgi:hypothetical protein
MERYALKGKYMKIILTVCFSIAISINAFAQELPSGNNTPEGVACDMATAFIKADSQLWRSTVYPSKKKDYVSFIDDIAKEMDHQKQLDKSERTGPKVIGMVFKMGHLSRNGPNSYAYAAMNLNEIGYVDVVTGNHDGSRSKNRTFVVNKEDKWFAIPRPDLFPLLTVGLNEEPVVKEVAFQLK